MPKPAASSTSGWLFIRIHFSRGRRFGPGRADLLAAVERTGSISEAARSMAMSYRRAWVLIAGTNQLFGRPVVAAAAGGRRGGGASLTPFGRSLLARFRRMEVAAERATRPDRHQLERWIANKP